MNKRRLITQNRIKEKMVEEWGFGQDYAGAFSWIFQGGHLAINSKIFRAVRHLRLATVMTFYRDLKGSVTYPNFKTDPIGIKAVMMADKILEGRGWEAGNVETYIANYYFCVKTPKRWNETKEKLFTLVPEKQEELIDLLDGL